MDHLEHRFRRWRDVVDARQVRDALRVSALSIKRLEASACLDDDTDEVDDPAPSASAYEAYGSSTAELRILANLGYGSNTAPTHYRPSCWGGRGFRGGTSRAAGLMAWKHWRHFVVLRRTRPHITGGLIDEEAAVVCWKHWRHFVAGRPLVHDQEVVVCWKHWRYFHAQGAARRARAEDMGRKLRSMREAELRRQDEEAMRAVRKQNLAEQRRRRREEDDRRHGYSVPRGQGKENEDALSPSKHRSFADENLTAGGSAPMDFVTFSYTVVCWRRWRGFTSMRRRDKEQKRREEEAEEARIQALGELHAAALERAKAAEKERRRLAEIARKRELKAVEMMASDDGREVAAIKLQARARTFLAVRRFALMRRNPFERVRGLRALLKRGQEAFDELNKSAQKSKEKCDAAERRLAHIRLANEDAMASVRLALGKLDDVTKSREPCGARWESRKVRIQLWERQYNESFEKDRKYGSYKPWPSFPSPKVPGEQQPVERDDGAKRLDEFLDGNDDAAEVNENAHTKSPSRRSGGGTRTPPPGAAAAAFNAVYRPPSRTGKPMEAEFHHPAAYMPESEIDRSIAAAERGNLARVRAHAEAGFGHVGDMTRVGGRASPGANDGASTASGFSFRP